MESDEELLERLAKGDTTAWEQLCTRHWSSVRRFFVAMVAPEQVDDLLHTTFTRLESAASRYRATSSFRGFLFGIAGNVLREFIRAKLRNTHAELDAICAIDLDPRPSTILCKTAEQRILLEALRRLSIEHQVVLELFYWEDLTANEIGEVLGINPNTVRSRIDRARGHLAESVRELEAGGSSLGATSTELDDWARGIRAVI